MSVKKEKLSRGQKATKTRKERNPLWGKGGVKKKVSQYHDPNHAHGKLATYAFSHGFHVYEVYDKIIHEFLAKEKALEKAVPAQT